MSNIVTFEQGERLKKIGFNPKINIFDNVDDYGRWYQDSEYISTTSEALDYLREEKGIACGVHVGYDDGIFYRGHYYYDDQMDNIRLSWTDRFDTHPLASSALLTAVLDYLEKEGGQG